MQRARTLLPSLALVAVVGAVPVIAADLSLEQVAVVPGDQPQVVIDLDDTAEGSAVSTFKLSGPDRLVIDIPEARVNLSAPQLPGDGALIDRIEVTEFDDGNGYITRITCYLTKPADLVEPQVVTDGRQIRVGLSASEAGGADPLSEAMSASSGAETAVAVSTDGMPDPSGPNRIAAEAAVTSLDFRNEDVVVDGVSRSVSQIVVGTRGAGAPDVRQPQPNLITVDVPGAFLPQSLKRVLDTSEFLSPVRLVRAYSTRNGARIAISLRSETTFSVVEGEGGLFAINIDIPPQMLQDRDLATGFDGVAPTQGGGRIESGSASEVLIGGSGRSMDPNAAFGAGMGADGGLAGLGSFQSRSSTTAYTGKRISLDFVDADIHSIFRLISHVSRLNIVASDDVQGKVTVRMIDVPWDQALAAVLQAKGLGSQQFGNIIRVAPIETIKAEQQAALETQRAIEEMTELQLLILPLNYVQASDVSEQLEDLISDRGSVQVDSTSNQLIVQETERTLAQIRELVRNIDRQTPQVLIEARVVEANSNYAQALGIQWGAEVDASTRTGYATGAFFPNNIGVSGGLSQAGAGQFYTPGADSLMVDMGAEGAMSGVSFNLGSIPGLVDLDARLSAMESDGWGKVVSQPRVTTLDNRTAVIRQGSRIPFLSTSAGGTNVQFVDAYLQLDVTPHITSDSKVFLTIEVRNDRADFSTLVMGQPAIAVKRASTELLVDDGDTTVMGGVFSSEQSFSQDRVPGLSKIPLLGYLFKNSAEMAVRNELLVFITPHIVTRPTRDGG